MSYSGVFEVAEYESEVKNLSDAPGDVYTHVRTRVFQLPGAQMVCFSITFMFNDLENPRLITLHAFQGETCLKIS